MTAQEFVSFLDRYIADKTPNFGDGDSVLTLLYEAYNDANNMDSDDIKAGFHELCQGRLCLFAHALPGGTGQRFV